MEGRWVKVAFVGEMQDTWKAVLSSYLLLSPSFMPSLDQKYDCSNLHGSTRNRIKSLTFMAPPDQKSMAVARLFMATGFTLTKFPYYISTYYHSSSFFVNTLQF